jgi:hypothetical protein
MIEAIKECDSITGRSVPTLLSASYNPIRPNCDYVNAIHSEVSALIPLFVNHLDHSGDWNGQTTIPNWTEATILTAIGDASRIVPSNLNVLSPWYFQQYKILNMLRWSYLETYSDSRWISHGFTKTVNVNPGTWADVQAAFLTQAWSADDTTRDAPRYYAINYSSQFYKFASKITREWENIIPHSVDLYHSSGGYPSYIFQPIGSQILADLYYLVNTYPENSSHSLTLWEDDDLADLPSPETSGGPYNQKTNYVGGSSANHTPKAVLKFDGANGRKFRDW